MPVARTTGAEPIVPRGLRAGHEVVGEHGQKWHPGTDLVPILLRHHTRGLSQVSQVVYHPGREQLPQCHAPQARVLAGEVELPRGELPGAEQLQVRGAQPGELGEQRLQGAAFVTRSVAEAIVRLEADVRSPREDDACARYPIGLLAVDQMSHHIERTERVGTFSAPGPGLVHAVEQRLERGGRASQYVDGEVEIEIHRSL